MSQTLLRDTIICCAAFLLVLLGPDRTMIPFFLEAIAIYILALLQEHIDQGRAA